MSATPASPITQQDRPACMGFEQGDSIAGLGCAVSSNCRRDQRTLPPSAQKRRRDDSEDPAAKRFDCDSSAEESNIGSDEARDS